MSEQPKELFTKMPNHILDSMEDMSNQCLRVVLAVVRKTAGWHKEKDIISHSQFAEMTNLSNSGVKNGIKEALEKKFIRRERVNPFSTRSGFYYAIDMSHSNTKRCYVVPTQKKEEKSNFKATSSYPDINDEDDYRAAQESEIRKGRREVKYRQKK